MTVVHIARLRFFINLVFLSMFWPSLISLGAVAPRLRGEAGSLEKSFPAVHVVIGFPPSPNARFARNAGALSRSKMKNAEFDHKIFEPWIARLAGIIFLPLDSRQLA